MLSGVDLYVYRVEGLITLYGIITAWKLYNSLKLRFWRIINMLSGTIIMIRLTVVNAMYTYADKLKICVPIT